MITPYWTVFAGVTRCGAEGGHDVPPGVPVRIISPIIRRCQVHSAVAVDEHEVAAAKRALAGPEPVEGSGFLPLSAAAANVSKLYDVKARAAGGDE